MPTRIKFTGAADNIIVVAEDAESVRRALASAPGETPARLTEAESGAPVYVNPTAVACWTDGAAPRREDSGVASSMSPL